MRFGWRRVQIHSGRIRPTFGLWTLMVVVLAFALAMTLEVERRMREARRRLDLISAGRRTKIEPHALAARKLREQARWMRKYLDAYEHPPAATRPIEGWTEIDAHGQYLRLHEELPCTEERAEWELLMSLRAAWAADHPAQAWPPEPPEPLPLAQRGPSKLPPKLLAPRPGRSFTGNLNMPNPSEKKE